MSPERKEVRGIRQELPKASANILDLYIRHKTGEDIVNDERTWRKAVQDTPLFGTKINTIRDCMKESSETREVFRPYFNRNPNVLKYFDFIRDDLAREFFVDALLCRIRYDRGFDINLLLYETQYICEEMKLKVGLDGKEARSLSINNVLEKALLGTLWMKTKTTSEYLIVSS